MRHHYSFQLFIFSFLMVACVQQNDIKEASLTKMGHTGTQVSIDEAESQLIASLEVLYPSTKNGVQRRIENKFSKGGHNMTRSGEYDSPLVHIFNFNDNLGFAIMSGDRRVEPIICITGIDAY